MTNTIYACPKCPQTYTSPVRLSEPPTHHCPSIKSQTVRSFVEREKASC